MIKINLASRKKGGGESKARASVGPKVNIEAFKDLPIRKAVACVATLGVVYYALDTYQNDELAKLDEERAKVQAQQEKLKSEINKLKDFEAVKKSLDSDEKMIKNKLETIKKLVSDRANPPKVLISIANSIPKDVWLSELNADKSGINFKGGSLGFTQISDFMKNLSENAFFTNVELANTAQQGQGGSTQTEIADGDLANFEIKAKWR